VLQALALVVRRTASSDPELARVARDSDRDLRAFLAGAAAGPASSGHLLPAVREVSRRAARPFDLDVTVAAVDDDITLDASTVTAVAGAVGEAITNVGKHAGVGRAVVFVERQDDGTIFVSVRDEGRGFTTDVAVDGRGIRSSIVGRITDAGGRAEVVSEPQHGTEVRMWVR
jgi:signal transduction histidine kinase